MNEHSCTKALDWSSNVSFGSVYWFLGGSCECVSFVFTSNCFVTSAGGKFFSLCYYYPLFNSIDVISCAFASMREVFCMRSPKKLLVFINEKQSEMENTWELAYARKRQTTAKNVFELRFFSCLQMNVDWISLREDKLD